MMNFRIADIFTGSLNGVLRQDMVIKWHSTLLEKHQGKRLSDDIEAHIQLELNG